MFLHDYGDIFSLQNKADKSASNSLNPSLFEGLVTLCAPDAVCFSRHIPHASGRILAERFCVIGTLRSNFLLHKKSRDPYGSRTYMGRISNGSLTFDCDVTILFNGFRCFLRNRKFQNTVFIFRMDIFFADCIANIETPA